MGEFQSTTYSTTDIHRLVYRHTIFWRVFYESFYVSASHKLRDHKRLAFLLSKVKYRDYMRVGAQPTHRLSFANPPMTNA